MTQLCIPNTVIFIESIFTARLYKHSESMLGTIPFVQCHRLQLMLITINAMLTSFTFCQLASLYMRFSNTYNQFCTHNCNYMLTSKAMCRKCQINQSPESQVPDTPKSCVTHAGSRYSSLPTQLYSDLSVPFIFGLLHCIRATISRTTYNFWAPLGY